MREFQWISTLNIHWKDWCWSWSFNILATWCKELTHLKRPWCWERLRAGGEGDNRGWDGWLLEIHSFHFRGGSDWGTEVTPLGSEPSLSSSGNLGCFWNILSLDFLICKVQFNHSVVSNSLQPHEMQHSRPPCPSPPPGVHPNPCPLSRWCHPTILPSVIPFSSCLQSFPAQRSFPTSQLFVSGGQSIGISASTSVLPRNTQDWSPLGWTGWISLQSKGLSRVFSNVTVQKHQFFGAQLSL